jgi:hypothetical protein
MPSELSVVPVAIVRGTPSAEEVAALVAVLASRRVALSASSSVTVSAWADPAARMRQPLRVGPGAWHRSALPRSPLPRMITTAAPGARPATARIAIPAPEHTCRYDHISPVTLVALRLMPQPRPARARNAPNARPVMPVRAGQREGLPLREDLTPVLAR